MKKRKTILITIFLLSVTFAFYFYRIYSNKSTQGDQNNSQEISAFQNLIYEEEVTPVTPSIQSLYGIFKLIQNPNNFESFTFVDLQTEQVIGIIEDTKNNTYNIRVINSYYSEVLTINSQVEINHCNESNTWIGDTSSVSKISSESTFVNTISGDKLYVMSIFCSNKDCTQFIDLCYIHTYE